jgi:hypothetical protein
MTQSCGLMRQGGVAFSLGIMMVFTCLVPPRAAAQYPANLGNDGTTLSHSGDRTGKMMSTLPDDPTGLRTDGTPTLTAQQKRYIVRFNFEKSKSDAAELAALAKGLREELKKPDANVLSAEVTNRIDKIEKLAKKIRDETKEF